MVCHKEVQAHQDSTLHSPMTRIPNSFSGGNETNVENKHYALEVYKNLPWQITKVGTQSVHVSTNIWLMRGAI